MFGRRRQTARLGTRTVRRAARTVGRVLQRARPYADAKPIKRAVRAFAAGATYPFYKAGRKLATKALTFDAPGNDLSTSKAIVGRKKKPTVNRINRLMKAAMNNHVYRYQMISQYDTNVGALTLPHYSDSTTGQVGLPLHIYELTCFPNTAPISPGKAFRWSATTTNADIVRYTLPTQNPDGTTDTTGEWKVTDQTGVLTGTVTTDNVPNAAVFMHNWSSIALNLYGARRRTTKFVVTFFRVTEDAANPFQAATTNTDLKQLIEYMTRPFIYSNLQSYDTKMKHRIKVVKQFTYYIPGGQTTDIDTAVGKIKEVKIFMRHDKLYRLDHMSDGEARLPHNVADGIDYIVDGAKSDHPWPSSRLYMAIRAFAPERSTFAVAAGEYGPTPAQISAGVDPSYDIIIKNSITTP